MEARKSFPADITTPRAARQFVGGLIGGPEEESTQVALVLTSELVTNAVMHARTPLDIRVNVEPDQMRVDVRDHDPTLPWRRSCSPDALGGRGLHLVDALATTWGAEPCPDGKVVWFTLRNGGPPWAGASG